MFLALTAVCVAVQCVLTAIWVKRTRDRDEMKQHSITPEALHTLLASNQEVFLFDVRQPLDLLTHSEIIPGAKWITPKEVFDTPLLIPKAKDSVVYCTCSGNKTSLEVLRRGRAMSFFRMKFLDGGLAAWKAKSYPVEPYQKTFHLDTVT
jgi:rhodanese-related sulfurtransferase